MEKFNARTCTPLAHTLTLAHLHIHTLTYTHTHTHTHTQEEKVKELHEAILPPLLRQLNHMVESNNFAKGWIWGDKVYTYDEREEGVCVVSIVETTILCVSFSNLNYAKQ